MMKKTRKLLSIVLSVLIVMASMPMMYTATAASDISAYATAQQGTIDNPTDPVSESGEYSQHETNQLSYSQKSLNFTYYQTMNDEYFQIYQASQMEKYCGSMTASVSVTLGDYVFGSDAVTTEFMNLYYQNHAWTAGTGASANVAFPNGFELAGNYWTGCEDYSWSLGVVFKGAPAGKTGTITTGYTQHLSYTTNVDGTINNYQTPITTTITILDARELVQKMSQAEEIVENPENYTKEYVSSVQATLNSIPDDLKDFSAVYSQDAIDGYVNDFENISKNSADYTEYNSVYETLNSITNAKGAFTDKSYAAYKAELNRIDTALPKNLDYTRQQEVADATQALREAYKLLVHKGEQNTASSSSVDVEDVTFVVGNDFKFVQIEDNQKLSFSQPWTIYRGSKDSDRRFYSALDTSDAATNTFISKLSTVATNQTINTNAVKNGLSGVSIFNCWEEYTSTGELKDSSEVIDRATGKINPGYAGFKNGETYYLESAPVFTGLSATESGEHVYTFKQNIYVSYYAWFSTTYGNSSITTTLTITDARKLVAAVNEAENTLANPGNHTEAYITALQAAVNSVPAELYRGVEYYTQAEVDKLYNDITTIPENVADYSEFVEVFEKMTSVNKDKYVDDSYNSFLDEVYAINQGLAKNLPADQQATIDAAVDALYAAYDKLVSTHLNGDNIFTEGDAAENLGYNPLEFSLSSTSYNFMITEDNQKFALTTDLSLRKTRTDYNCYFRGVGFYAELTEEEKTAGYIAPDCSTDQGCHGLDAITSNQTRTVVASCTGLEKYTARDDGGNIARHNTWVNTSGPNLISNNTFITDVAVSTTESTAQAEMYYTGPVGGDTQEIAVDYVLWLGWWYVQPFFGENLSEKTYRHVHIPVNVKFTDARALNDLYSEVENIINGKTDTDYTFESLLNIYNAYKAVPDDMPNGDTYYTQEQVNAQYAALKGAYEELVEGADYSEYFKAYVKAEEIINSGNTDSRGNSLYDDATYENFVNTVTGIENGLDKGLVADEEGKNQATVDAATSSILGAIDVLEATKRADYSELNDAMTEAEKILNAPEGTYTDKTVKEVRNAYNNAVNLDKELPASEQAQVDAVASALKAAVNSADFKADYSEFEEAYQKVQDIVNNPDEYTQQTVKNAQEALEEADKLDKDLADLNETRQTISDATDALNSVLEGAEKKADYTEFDKVVDELENIVNNPDDYTEETVKNAQDALDNVVSNVDKDLPESQQPTLDEVTSNLQDVIDSAEKKADYTDYNNAKTEADNLVNDDGNGNPIYDEEAFDAYKEAVNNVDTALDKNLPATEQETVNNAVAELENLKAELENNKKADYTDFDAAKDALEEIVNAPAGTYTDETVKNAQTALDEANKIPADMVVGENNANQNIIDAATDAMQGVIDSAEKKADYTEFDKVVDELENIVNNPDDYTEETVKNAQDALDNVVSNVDKDLPESQQPTLDEVTSNLQGIVDSAEKKADYTDYNNAKSEADSLVNDDGNGNPIYDEEAFDAYKEAVNNVDTALDKNLPESSQSVVDGATNALENLKATLESKKIYTVTFIGLNGEVLAEIEYVNGSVFGTISAPALPESTDTVAYVGWLNADVFMVADSVLTGDVTLTVASEFKKLVANDESAVVLDDENVTGINKDTTVEQLIAQLQNDETVVEIKHYTGAALDSLQLVGTGSTITLKSKYTGAIYETKTVIIYGDVDGDGDVDEDDFNKSTAVGLGEASFEEGQEYFFIANDLCKDDVIDALDSWMLGLIKNGRRTVLTVE